MPIDVKRPSRHHLSRMQTRFALQQDDWNDYSFRTLYHLYYRASPEETDVTYIGGVKILQLGQEAGQGPLIRAPFRSLRSDFASVGTTLDYYQRLNELPLARRTSIMQALNDVVANPALVESFEGEDGWRRSLFRDNSDWRQYLDDARILYDGSFSALPDLTTSFTYQPAGAEEPIKFDFSAPEPAHYMGPYRRLGPKRKRTLLPDRMIVLVGRNGSGKSTILSRLAHVAFASPQERATRQMRQLGTLDPTSIGFMRVITISYSAFDSFVVPGFAAKDLTQTTEDLESGESRFVFCGLRDLVAEGRADVRRAVDDASAEGSPLMVERRTTTCLKSVDVLADEFADLLSRIRRDDLNELLQSALEPLLSDPSFADLRPQLDRLLTARKSALRSIFLGWSTGHKIALHVIASLVAHARPRSLILFDEPEAHLHPPLMAALMHSVRLVLAHVNAFCVVATHSPVLLQETLGRHVRLVHRVGSSVDVQEPGLETFGENVGIITYDAFGLTASSTDYHKVLDLLVAGCDSIEEIDALFSPGLSAQARAYVMSGLARKG